MLEALAVRESVGSAKGEMTERQLGRAERRLQAALKALSVLRRLRGPAVVSVTQVGQVNVAGGAMAVDNRR